ncbi:hypothetical protein HJC23_002845 [Cyclotella cryptica]|uniref:tRNA/rRNA methyltransferase SpoU type domain-containing protein n=1 Tax=Cyclotella cryptica TaxID=29204 RepID=A0ABD3P659_9STRA
MLCYDYDKCHSIEEKCRSFADGSKDVSPILSNSALLLLNTVVVMPRESLETGKSLETNIVRDDNSITQQTKRLTIEVSSNRRAQKSLLAYYEEAIDHFHSVVFGKNKNIFKFYRPKLIYEDEAIKSLFPILSKRQQHNKNSNYVMQPTVVGIDLHSDALTLSGDYKMCKNFQSQYLQCPSDFKATDCAIKKLEADAIVFGYESIGIPDCIKECSWLNAWVQIPCRSSINVVATMSIIFDALFGRSHKC